MGDQLAHGNFSFNGSILVTSRSESISSDGGALLLREMLERTEIDRWLGDRLRDSRDRRRIEHPLMDLVRTQVLQLAQGYQDHSDVARVKDDPCMRLGTDGRRGLAPVEDGSGRLASQPTLSRLLKMLSGTANLAVLRQSVGELAIRRMLWKNRGRRQEWLIVDVDGAPVRVSGEQPGSKFNKHYRGQMYHGILAFDGDGGDLLGAALRPGTEHVTKSAGGMIREIARQHRGHSCERVLVRMDAAFSGGGFLDELEEIGVDYVSRLRNNRVLEEMARPHICSAPGNGLRLHEMRYRAGPWTRERRVVLVVVEKPGALVHDHFWLVTSLPKETLDASALLETYRQRGTAEAHIGELMDCVEPTLSSSPRPKSHYRGNPVERPSDGALQEPGGDADEVEPANEALFQINALTCNLMHWARRLLESATGKGWRLRRFREQVLKVGCRVLRGGRQLNVVIPDAAATHWDLLMARMQKLHWTEG